jgi:hypothetical protein
VTDIRLKVPATVVRGTAVAGLDPHRTSTGISLIAPGITNIALAMARHDAAPPQFPYSLVLIDMFPDKMLILRALQ